MGIFICEKCGKLDNTACGNNYYTAKRNKFLLKSGRTIEPSYKSEYEYFETHSCCSDCCVDVEYKDKPIKLSQSLSSKFNIKDKKHWTFYGKERLLELEARHDGSCENATEFFNNLNE